VELSGAANKSI